MKLWQVARLVNSSFVVCMANLAWKNSGGYVDPSTSSGESSFSRATVEPVSNCDSKHSVGYIYIYIYTLHGDKSWPIKQLLAYVVTMEAAPSRSCMLMCAR